MICEKFSTLIATLLVCVACEQRFEVGRDLVIDVTQESDLDAGAVVSSIERDATLAEEPEVGEQDDDDEFDGENDDDELEERMEGEGDDDESDDD